MRPVWYVNWSLDSLGGDAIQRLSAFPHAVTLAAKTRTREPRRVALASSCNRR